MSSITVATSLPEIVALISTELNPQTLNSCVQVCRSWHEVFIPFLYRKVSYSYRQHTNPASRIGSSVQGQQDQQHHPGCSFQGFQRHGRHIRTLHVRAIEFPEPDVFGPDCQQLTALHLHPVNQPKGAPPPQWNSRLQALVDRNPKIQTFELHPVHRRPCEGIFFDLNIVRRLPELKSLALTDSFAVAMNTFDEILACGPRLRELNYHISLLMPGSFDCGTSGSVSTRGIKAKEKEQGTHGTKDYPAMWTRLISLTVSDQVGSRAIELIERCPYLRNLYLKLWNDDNTEAILRQLLRHRSMGYPSRLEHLRLYRLRKEGHLLADLLRVCNESSRLKSFWIDSCVASHEVMTELLRFHARSLEKVVLMFPLHEGRRSKGKKKTSSAQDLLASCPSLKHLEIGLSDKVYMEDLIQSPWVCQGLEHLELQIMGRGATTDRCQEEQERQEAEGGEEEEEELSSPSSSSSSDESSYGRCYGIESSPVPAVVDLDENIEVQQQLWQQIGRLSQLRKLHIHADMSVGKRTSTLSVTHGGLEALCKLKRLVELKISRGKHILTDLDREMLSQKMPNVRIIHPR